ncbi:hypothetical protein [Bacillus phage vB_Bpu_PumA2]|uniref:Uncharacterized protein n=1 Tax=Bacillus phage vB_Bpu_PumA2 TaxID=2662128 RepID=A0A5Q2WDA0_9CAUD|nr:hypothetical protein H3021_gp01 [Bacillus phage vB_Bpu_PumA2]QGH74220.1 hypothetical protein [Bacillus phage vB_Bpu_PumA2]
MIIDSSVLQTIIAVLVLQSMSIVFAGFMMIRMTHELYKFKRTFDQKVYVIEPDYLEMFKQTFDEKNKEDSKNDVLLTRLRSNSSYGKKD